MSASDHPPISDDSRFDDLPESDPSPVSDCLSVSDGGYTGTISYFTGGFHVCKGDVQYMVPASREANDYYAVMMDHMFTCGSQLSRIELDKWCVDKTRYLLRKTPLSAIMVVREGTQIVAWSKWQWWYGFDTRFDHRTPLRNTAIDLDQYNTGHLLLCTGVFIHRHATLRAGKIWDEMMRIAIEAAEKPTEKPFFVPPDLHHLFSKVYKGFGPLPILVDLEIHPAGVPTFEIRGLRMLETYMQWEFGLSVPVFRFLRDPRALATEETQPGPS